jgi:hypothetical protein
LQRAPRQHAWYVYDDDGNMAKGVVAGNPPKNRLVTDNADTVTAETRYYPFGENAFPPAASPPTACSPASRKWPAWAACTTTTRAFTRSDWGVS